MKHSFQCNLIAEEYRDLSKFADGVARKTKDVSWSSVKFPTASLRHEKGTRFTMAEHLIARGLLTGNGVDIQITRRGSLMLQRYQS